MKSPARQHFERVSAAQAAGATPTGQPQGGEQYELHAAALWEARRTLKAIKSLQAKAAKKRELLPDFIPYISGVLENGNGAKDDVLMTLMVWCIDINDYATALKIGAYAVHHQIETPDQYDRDTVSILAEEIAESVKAQLLKPDANINELVTVMARTAEIVDGHDMHDQIKAKLHKFHGYALRENGDPQHALEQLTTALALDERAGVKQDIQQLTRQLKKQSAQATA